MRQRKSSKVRQMRIVFLVFCEGETEKAYVEMLNRHYRVPIIIKTKVCGTNISQNIVNRNMSVLGLEKDDCKVFFMYDSDVAAINKKLAEISGTPILTNPCIELWFLLHLMEQSRAETSSDIVKKLTGAHAVWKNYKKGCLSLEQQRILAQNQSEAIRRAKALSPDCNPSSSMPLFISQIEAKKLLISPKNFRGKC